MAVHALTDGDYWQQVPSSKEDYRAKAEAAGWKVALHAMGPDPDHDDDVPMALMLYIPPNQVLPRHTHDCHRVEVVVRGSLDVGDRVLVPGDLSTSAPGQFYGPHTAGPDGCLTVEIFSTGRGLNSRTEQGGRIEVAVAPESPTGVLS